MSNKRVDPGAPIKIGSFQIMWRRAETFIVSLAERGPNYSVLPPRIDLSAYCPLDLHWVYREIGLELLVVVPICPADEMVFYGDDGKGGDPIRGICVDDQPPEDLVKWFHAKQGRGGHA